MKGEKCHLQAFHVFLFLKFYGHAAFRLARQYVDIRKVWKLDEEKLNQSENNSLLAKDTGG